ncbi:MAG TPA: alkaline phosphatase family protein [Candidatus Kapabacteria bacterium]|jgi:predicted AlkP superfamily pyrophosphatase or phosphodiesterase|nr:alkaline phosphatase family protein [Candidatus Kapabacteria bacterium]
MIDEESLHVVGQSRFGEHFTKPLYEGYAFAQLPQTIRSLLTDDHRRGIPFGPREDLYQKYDTVILFFIDAFGWRFVSEYMEHPFLERFERDGLISKISAQFPSTTSAHVTTIHSGLPIGQSGIYEWYYYEPVLDAVISPLLYSFAGDKNRDTLLETGVDPLRLFPSDTVYFDLDNHGVHSYVIQDHSYTHSPYTEIVTNGAVLVPYRSLAEAIVTLQELIERQTEKTYYFLYYDKIDSVCHEHGPTSRQLEAEIQVFLSTMEMLVQPMLEKTRDRTLFLMTADHAHVEVDPATCIYINEALPELLPLIRRNRSGKLIAPAGSARDMFVHVNEGCLEEACAMLKPLLDGRAEIFRTDDLIEEGFFGITPPSAAFLSRVGDLVILPYAGESVWWYEQGRFEQKLRGSHGGLTPAEMETVLLAMRYGK